MLTLLLAVPVLIAGAVAWWTMQHRGPDGAFHANLAPIESPSRIIVIPDLDAVLRRDAPIARADETTLRVRTDGFIGIAEPGDVAAYLAGAGYTELQGVTLGRGPLPLSFKHFSGTGAAPPNPLDRDFWLRRGSGELSWQPSLDRDRQVTLVIVAPPPPAASPPVATAPPAEGAPATVATPAGPAPVAEPVRIDVAVTAGWLNSTAWGLLILGPVLLLLGLAALAWPQRPREIVYVMDPAAAVQAGLPAPPGVQAGLSGHAHAPAGLPGATGAQPGLSGHTHAPAGLPGAAGIQPGLSGHAHAPAGLPGATAVQPGLPAAAATPQFPPVNVAYQPIRPYTPPVQSNPPSAELPWPPAEPTEETSPASDVPDSRPMPVAGVHLHITAQRTDADAHVDEPA